MNAIPRTKIEKYWLDQFDANDIQAQLLVQRYSLFIKKQKSTSKVFKLWSRMVAKHSTNLTLS